MCISTKSLFGWTVRQHHACLMMVWCIQYTQQGVNQTCVSLFVVLWSIGVSALTLWNVCFVWCELWWLVEDGCMLLCGMWCLKVVTYVLYNNSVWLNQQVCTTVHSSRCVCSVCGENVDMSHICSQKNILVCAMTCTQCGNCSLGRYQPFAP